ncbi:TRAP transporter small permease [Acuticoccus kandeliae]|uniref:TRAP transporter small permease n=1 Tax=Acuticoccus kandeliae TaxID=2073160 RepID=UPI000D3E381A|nr:TRAP transporter small permease subunit [Acuticoccus kandeliae]
MTIDRQRWTTVARALADAVPAILLVTMFLCFIVQVFMRYVMNDPVGWTVEVCVMAWLWILLWGQSVAAREDDEIRFDIVYGAVPPKVRRVFRMAFAAFLVGIYAYSLPALWDYVTFMRIEKTSYLDIRFNWVFSIAIIFSVVSILRYLWIFYTAARARRADLEAPDHSFSPKDLTE